MALTAPVVESERQKAIVGRIVTLEECTDLAELRSLIADPVGSVFET